MVDIPGSARITELLGKINAGDRDAEAELVPLVYKQLRDLARHQMRMERPGHTLQTTGLLHEAYLRLMGGHGPNDWMNRTHFFAVAASVMRRILIDYARARCAEKRIGARRRTDLNEAKSLVANQSWDQILDIDEALMNLAKIDSRQARIVELRFFAGLEIDEVAQVLGISGRTVKRDWQFAQTWLYGHLESAYAAGKSRKTMAPDPSKSRIS